ncbi:hypothetical protein ACFFF5_02070 [Lederbergia wuyishanensis]|uniref:Uncharacterized protein n=1 Tax=Lederbergia wuyishanensis TaxID=1347903 RepID=A0ABU0D0V4_9BACI|nr:hypothetical protein [Lederbergia wuyishanensis]MCJ8006632.1 hypothetical protein [Lederbergia wuyishanensis]MDQ0342013.1 hypothetical protein [Lederbergia wuyishanensis]
MAQTLNEMEIISKAIYSSYDLLKKEEVLAENALASLKEAEESLNKAIEYVLSNRRTERTS